MRAIVVGAGLTGSVIGRKLAENGFEVEICERREHIAGNMYDYRDEHGIMVHKYGSHSFHTNKKALVDYLSRFEDWKEYHLTCGAVINGVCTPSPFNYKTIDDYFPENAQEVRNHIERQYPNQETATVLDVLQNDDSLVRGYAEFLFKNDYSLYTAKQWGVSPAEIDPSILKRVPLRFSYKEGYFDDTYQIIPTHSYTTIFSNMLNHVRIKVILNTDALQYIKIKGNMVYVNDELFDGLLVYTGPLDELFNSCYGALPYRSLRFDWKYTESDSFQKYPVVAYPQAEGYTRITEYKKLPVQLVKGSSYAVEYPLQYEPGLKQEPYYPLLTKESQEQYRKYKEMAETINGLVFCGRLADYKYYNMDQALERALCVADEIINNE